jgi:hypothetical protein
MIRLKCKRVPHPSCPPDLAISDFDLFGVFKQQLQGFDVSDHEELKSDIRRHFQDVSSDELKKSFDHWIERCHWVAENARNYDPSSS